MSGLEIVAVSTAVVYLFVIVLLRLFGVHPMTQLLPVDLVILMLLGSAVETSMVHASTGLKAGLISAALLIAMNYAINLALLKSKRLKMFVSGGPIILVNHGLFLDEHLKRAGLTKMDVMQALRAREFGDVSEVRLAVLEPDGDINVVPNPERSEAK